MSRGYRKYDQIRLMRPISLASDERTFVIDDPDDGMFAFDVPVQDDYYVHANDFHDSTHGYALLAEVQDLINATMNTATYSIEPWTPVGSDLLDSGIQIKRDPAADFTLSFSHGSWTLDPRLLGWGASQTTDVTGGGSPLGSPYSLYGVWHSPHPPSDLRDGRTKSIYESSRRSNNPRRIGFGGPRRRRMRFFAVRAAHIREDAALDQEWADKGGLPLNDVHNALMEFLWEGGLADKLLVDYAGGAGLPYLTDKAFEAVRFAPADALEELMDEFEDVPGEEQYSFEFSLELTSDSPVYRDP